jgi:hypothetical protein
LKTRGYGVDRIELFGIHLKRREETGGAGGILRIGAGGGIESLIKEAVEICDFEDSLEEF